MGRGLMQPIRGGVMIHDIFRQLVVCLMLSSNYTNLLHDCDGFLWLVVWGFFGQLLVKSNNSISDCTKLSPILWILTFYNGAATMQASEWYAATQITNNKYHQNVHSLGNFSLVSECSHFKGK